MDMVFILTLVGLVFAGIAGIHFLRRRRLRATKAAMDYAAQESALRRMLEDGRIDCVVREQFLDLTTIMGAFNAKPSLHDSNNQSIVIACDTVWDVFARQVDVADERHPSVKVDDTARTNFLLDQLDQGKIDIIAEELLGIQLRILLLVSLAPDADELTEKNKIALDAMKITSIMLNSALKRARGEQI